MANRGSTKSFTNAVSEWTEKAIRDATDIARAGAKEFVAEYQDATPKVSGNLANSTHVAASPADLIKGTPDQKYADPTAANNAVIDAMELGDKVYVAQVAAYSGKAEFGYVGSDGTPVAGHFQGLTTAAKWKGMVRRLAKLRGRKVK